MQARRRSQYSTLIVLVGLVTCSGCQRLNGPLAWLKNDDAKPAADIARGPVGVMQGNSFASAKPTSQQKADVQIAFARTVEREGDLQGAMKIYQQIIESSPKHPESYHRMAVLHDQSGNHDEALRYYKDAIKRDPRNAEIHADRGYSFYLQQNWPEAEQNLRRALKLDSSLARAHNNLGLLLARTDRQNEAMLEFQMAGSNEPECRANLIHAMMLDQRWNEAQQQCEIALASHEVPAAVEKRLKRLNSLITESQQDSQAPPSQADFIPSAGQQASHVGLPAAATAVSYESVQDIRALPPVSPIDTPAIRSAPVGSFQARPVAGQ